MPSCATAAARSVDPEIRALRSFYRKAGVPQVNVAHRAFASVAVAVAVSAPLLGLVAYSGI